MKISIAMAAYKGERFLREQLDSIARQTLLPYELVITDDSPDSGTADIAFEFARGVPFPVRVVRNEQRLGFHENFFKAISLCEGDFVAFCDQDDIWADNKLERVAEEFVDPDVMLVVHGVKVVDGDLNVRDDNTASHWSYRGIYDPLTTNPWYVLFGMSTVVRHSIYDYIDWRDRPEHPIDPGFAMSHDTWAWFVATSLGKISAIDDPLVLYRQHGANSCGVAPDRDVGEKVEMTKAAGATHYRRMATAAFGRADKMLQVSRTAPLPVRKRAAAAVDYYRALGERLRRRADLYCTATSTVSRAGTVARLFVSGAYGSLNHGGLGRRALLKDVHATVFRVSIE
ncbi:glycosyltransferase family 2 protein [Paraburkholderia sp. GAS42]|uniref:glycosyltransferase family 2 protein n=1 Tax=Paraburkholderia sp. GAS42 TaxID=3035135 RepID=UPI003D262082